MYAFVVAAALIAIYFLATAVRQPRAANVLAGILWAAYTVYEYYVANGTLCDANCNIRVDFLLFFPLLGIASFLALRKQDSVGAVTLLAVVCLVLVAGLGSLFGNLVVATLAGLGAVIVGIAGLRSRFLANRP